MTEGVDYSYGRPDPDRLYAAGMRFACRYLTVVNGTTQGKLLTRTEADNLIAAGLSIVSNFEYQAGDARGGRDAGVRYAKLADQEHCAAGGPPDRPIYFSVDWDASNTDLAGPVHDYFEGIASVLGVERTGAYGGYRTIDYLLDRQLVTWAWQTYAWSGGRWDARAHIQQYRNGVTVAGADCDLDRATVDDFGQWGQDMPLSAADLKAIAKTLAGDKDFLDAVATATWKKDIIPAPTGDVAQDDLATNPTWGAQNSLHDAIQVGRESAAVLAELKAALAAVTLPPAAGNTSATFTGSVEFTQAPPQG